MCGIAGTVGRSPTPDSVVDGMLAVQQGKKAPWTQTPMDMPK
jgi:hypothetical protein